MPEEHSVDFLKKKYNLAPKRVPRKRKKMRKNLAMVLFFSLAAVGVLFSYQVVHTSSQSENDSLSLFSPLKHLITSADKTIRGEENDRTNILLMGIGGAGHEGPELTDTMIFTSIKPSTNDVSMLSIPRDMVVPMGDYGWRKVNHANAYGESEEAGTGPDLAVHTLEEVLAEPINYYVKIDFDSFEEVIDAIGGVDIYVERSFTDYSYPTDDYLTQTLSFEAGWQHMDGETALQFARSRKGTNGEGSDFARAARQQKVITAAKDKLLSTSTLLNPGRLNNLVQIFNKNVDTNMSIWEMIRLAKLAPNVESDKINHFVLDDAPGSPLYSSTINGSYVLLPKRDDWSDVQYLVENMFNDEELNFTSTRDLKAPEQTVRVEIQNGTFLSGLASEAADVLMGSGFDVIEIGNADTRGYDRTIIYDLTDGAKSSELEILKEFLSADIGQSASGWLTSPEIVPRELSLTDAGSHQVTSDEEIDFLIILGQNAQGIVLQ